MHNPLDYNQSNNDPNAKKKRLAKYLFPVVIVSILFNIPKFFEAKYITTTEQVKSNKWYFVTKIVLIYCEKIVLDSDREKLLKFEAEGREFAKFLRSLEQFIQTVKGQNNFW